mmetsp:Transcript_32266/g.96033  ORF Transcript_32266/g.96033 Transcript_32266/m.96033 type:complete len:228 (-) Transcript_32266:578-1261(-)
MWPAERTLLVEAREQEERVVDRHGERDRHEHRRRGDDDGHHEGSDRVHERDGGRDGAQDVCRHEGELPHVAEHREEHHEGEHRRDGREGHPILDAQDDVLEDIGRRDDLQQHVALRPPRLDAVVGAPLAVLGPVLAQRRDRVAEGLLLEDALLVDGLAVARLHVDEDHALGAAVPLGEEELVRERLQLRLGANRVAGTHVEEGVEVKIAAVQVLFHQILQVERDYLC